MTDNHLHASLCLDRETPIAAAPQSPEGLSPFLFLSIGPGLDVWAHDPAAFRRLAEACAAAADALEDARIAFEQARASAAPSLGSAVTPAAETETANPAPHDTDAVLHPSKESYAS